MKKLAFSLLILMSAEVYASSYSNFKELASQCASNIAFDTLEAIVKTESSFNPYAVAVVNPHGGG